MMRYSRICLITSGDLKLLRSFKDENVYGNEESECDECGKKKHDKFSDDEVQ